MKHLSDIYVISTNVIIDEAVASVNHLMCVSEPLEVVLGNCDQTDTQGYEEVVVALSRLGGYSKKTLKPDIYFKNWENAPTKPTFGTTKLERKVLLTIFIMPSWR